MSRTNKTTEEIKDVEEEVEQEGSKEEVKRDSDAYLKELVPFYAFKDADKYKDDIIVGVNGKLFQIKRGVQVMIPRYVYNVIIQSMKQDEQTADLIEGYESSFSAEAKKLNI